MNFKDIVHSQKIIGVEIPTADAVHITFGVDQLYIPMMGICMTSLIKNNPARQFSFHVFLEKVDEADCEKLNELCQMSSAGVQITLYFLDTELFKTFYFTREYSIAIFYRIIAADFLSDKLDELLYLDSDMLCLKPIDELLENAPKENLLCAMAEEFNELIFKLKKTLDLTEEYRYFNTGLLYLNLKFWREANVTEQALDLLSRNKYQFPDQDALNIVVCKNNYPVRYLSKKFNNFAVAYGDKPTAITDDVVIEHFAGHLKPWYFWTPYEVRQVFEQYQAISPWRDYKYTPRNFKECHRMWRAHRKAGNYREALKWFWRYLKRRRVEKKNWRD